MFPRTSERAALVITSAVAVTTPDSTLKRQLRENYLFILDLPRVTALSATPPLGLAARVGGLSKSVPVAVPAYRKSKRKRIRRR